MPDNLTTGLMGVGAGEFGGVSDPTKQVPESITEPITQTGEVTESAIAASAEIEAAKAPEEPTVEVTEALYKEKMKRVKSLAKLIKGKEVKLFQGQWAEAEENGKTVLVHKEVATQKAEKEGDPDTILGEDTYTLLFVLPGHDAEATAQTMQVLLRRTRNYSPLSEYCKIVRHRFRGDEKYGNMIDKAQSTSVRLLSMIGREIRKDVDANGSGRKHPAIQSLPWVKTGDFGPKTPKAGKKLKKSDLANLGMDVSLI